MRCDVRPPHLPLLHADAALAVHPVLVVSHVLHVAGVVRVPDAVRDCDERRFEILLGKRN